MFAAVMLVVFSAVAMADGSGGYFARLGTNDAKWIPAAAFSGDPGPLVEIVSVNAGRGTYLITARVDGYSYGGNAGASCGIATPTDPYGGQNMGQLLTTKGDGVNLGWATGVILGKTTLVANGKVSISCQRGYSFTDATNVFGELLLVKISSE